MEQRSWPNRSRLGCARPDTSSLLVRLPFSWNPPEHVADAMLAAQLTNISGVDRVIALKFPAYLVPHHEKIVWLLHQFRQFYDVWDRDAPHDPSAETVRELVVRADDRHLAEARSLFANSDVTAQRLRRFNGLDAEVLYPPVAKPGELPADRSRRLHIRRRNRINTFKRQLLAVEAMTHTTSGVRLIVAGSPESSADLEALHLAREASGCRDRITVIPLRHRRDRQGRPGEPFARLCVFADRRGLVWIRDARRRPCLQGSDHDLRFRGHPATRRRWPHRHRLPARSARVGRAFDTLFRSPHIATELGRGADERMLELGISWDHVIRRLLA